MCGAVVTNKTFIIANSEKKCTFFFELDEKKSGTTARMPTVFWKSPGDEPPPKRPKITAEESPSSPPRTLSSSENENFGKYTSEDGFSYNKDWMDFTRCVSKLHRARPSFGSGKTLKVILPKMNSKIMFRLRGGG